MNNNLSALNNYLFEELERLTDDGLSSDQLKKEISRSQAVVRVGEAIIHNGELALKTINSFNEYGADAPVYPMLDGKQ